MPCGSPLSWLLMKTIAETSLRANTRFVNVCKSEQLSFF